MKCTKNRSKHAVKLNEKQLPWFSSTPAAEGRYIVCMMLASLQLCSYMTLCLYISCYAYIIVSVQGHSIQCHVIMCACFTPYYGLLTVNTTRPALTLALLMDEVATKTNEWEMIALHLDIDQVSIECIDRQECGNIKRCFYKIFEKWQKQQKPPFRWEEVIDALISPSVDEKALAKQLKEKYLK